MIEDRHLSCSICRAQNVAGNVFDVNLVAVEGVYVPVDDDDVPTVRQTTFRKAFNRVIVECPSVDDDIGETSAERLVGGKRRFGKRFKFLAENKLERFINGNVAAFDDRLLV